MTFDTVHRRVEEALALGRAEAGRRRVAREDLSAVLDVTEKLNYASYLVQGVAIFEGEALGSHGPLEGTLQQAVSRAQEAARDVSIDAHPEWWRVVATLNAAAEAVTHLEG